jgi:hypothetical protein
MSLSDFYLWGNIKNLNFAKSSKVFHLLKMCPTHLFVIKYLIFDVAESIMVIKMIFVDKIIFA